MAQIALTWIERKRFLGVDSTSHSVVLSGGDDVGVKPSDTLLIALGACAAYDVVEILQKQRLDLRRLAVLVDGEQAEQAPWPYRRIHLRVAAAAPGLRHEQLARATDLALNKYCSVRASLHPEIEVSFEVSVEEA
ncbi:MAG: OsmC family protein [Chloroflexi bacterium OHK40]